MELSTRIPISPSDTVSARRNSVSASGPGITAISTGTRGAQMRSRVGQRLPLSRTGIGKALLLVTPERWEATFDSESPVEQATHQTKEAFLSRMKTYASEGIALDLEDNEPGIRCVAAPIRDGSGQIIAAISMSATNPYMLDERMKALKSVMGSTAAQISRKLGYSGKTF